MYSKFFIVLPYISVLLPSDFCNRMETLNQLDRVIMKKKEFLYFALMSFVATLVNGVVISICIPSWANAFAISLLTVIAFRFFKSSDVVKFTLLCTIMWIIALWLGGFIEGVTIYTDDPNDLSGIHYEGWWPWCLHVLPLTLACVVGGVSRCKKS